MHLVHARQSLANDSNFAVSSDQNAILVVGVFIEVGDHNNKEFEEILKSIKDVSGTTKLVDSKYNDSLDKIIPQLDDIYYYQGSLTTPPCSENVNWVLAKNTISLSARQIGIFKKFSIPTNFGSRKLGSNFRQLQPLNGRQVLTSSSVPINWTTRDEKITNNIAQICLLYRAQVSFA